jgi:trehalose 6-phosphate phosphatase
LVVRKLGPVIIDPRRHDAVLIDLDAVLTAEGIALDSAVTLIRQLHEIGAGTAVFSAR